MATQRPDCARRSGRAPPQPVHEALPVLQVRQSDGQFCCSLHVQSPPEHQLGVPQPASQTQPQAAAAAAADLVVAEIGRVNCTSTPSEPETILGTRIRSVGMPKSEARLRTR